MAVHLEMTYVFLAENSVKYLKMKEAHGYFLSSNERFKARLFVSLAWNKNNYTTTTLIFPAWHCI